MRMKRKAVIKDDVDQLWKVAYPKSQHRAKQTSLKYIQYLMVLEILEVCIPQWLWRET